MTERWPANAKRYAKTAALFILSQWFLIGIGLVIMLAALFPNVGRHGGIIRSQWSVSYGLVALIFLISGLTIPLSAFSKRARAWKLHLSTQLTSFFLFPTVVFAICNIVRAGDPNFRQINQYALVGMMLMAVLPTTVSSNVVMTMQAGGDPSATTVEVLFGNTVGTFLSPALLEMFFSGPSWAFGRPVASGAGGTLEIYRQVAMQLGCAVFAPLFVGEVVQYFLPKPVNWLKSHVPLPKISSLCLLGVIWETFSGAFYENAFQKLSWQSIVFILLVNVALYIVFSLFLFALARLVPFPTTTCTARTASESDSGPDSMEPSAAKGDADSEHLDDRKEKKTTTGPLLDPELTIALLFCGAAKGVVVGGPTSLILYGGLADPVDRAIVTLPLVLYQGSQVVLGQITVAVLRRWKRRIDAAAAAAEGPGAQKC